MIRRAFIRRMAGAALASGLLGSELLARRSSGALPDPVEVSAVDIRNDVTVQWAGGQAGVRDMESVDKYGRRVGYIDATTDRTVNNADRAMKLAEQMIEDLAYPRLS